MIMIVRKLLLCSLVGLIWVQVNLAMAQTPDSETPANEGVCDGLIGGTPGLYGLCVAFCEAQDCNPDFSSDDPFAQCRAGSAKVLQNYDKRKQATDPDMPCIQQTACPCWTPDELAGLRTSAADDNVQCRQDFTGGFLVNQDFWDIRNSGDGYATSVVSVEERIGLGPQCLLTDTCGGDPSCLGVSRSLVISPEEFVACEQDVASSAANRGLDLAQQDCGL